MTTTTSRPVAIEKKIDASLIARVQAAIRATTISRSTGEEVWPECHKPRCQTCATNPYRDADTFFCLVIDKAVETVTAELLCEATTNPDLDARPPVDHAQVDALAAIIRDTGARPNGADSIPIARRLLATGRVTVKEA